MTLTDAEIKRIRSLLDGSQYQPWYVAWGRRFLPRLIGEAERSRALLRRIEWAGEQWGEHACPECGGTPQGVGGEGHAADCELAALIGKTSTVPLPKSADRP